MNEGICKKTIVVVDDDESIRFAISDSLEDMGYQVVVATDGQDALDKLRAAPELPCLVLLDLMMPGMDGWAFRAVQKSDPHLANIPVVVLTADAHVRQKAAELQADGHVAKPVKLKDLQRTAERFCNKATGPGN